LLDVNSIKIGTIMLAKNVEIEPYGFKGIDTIFVKEIFSHI
jgi:hypothetical protein